MPKFYDGRKLLSLKDINKKEPLIFICTSNRSAGKTTFFNKYLVDEFIKNNKKFILLYRYNDEISNIANKFFTDIHSLFFNDYHMTECKESKLFMRLFLNDVECGYAISLNGAEKLKKFSHIFSDVEYILFDEFQSENNNYTSNEITKFMSIYMTVARGQGKAIRDVKVFLLSNFISLLNPYYAALDITTDRLKENTKFLRGDGWVLEKNQNESVIAEQNNNAFLKAFENQSYIEKNKTNQYLNDNYTMIETIKDDKFKYLFNFICNDKMYSVKEFYNKNIIYVSKSVDKTFTKCYTVSSKDVDVNVIFINENKMLLSLLRMYFNRGLFKFDSLLSKNATIKLLSLY